MKKPKTITLFLLSLAWPLFAVGVDEVLKPWNPIGDNVPLFAVGVDDPQQEETPEVRRVTYDKHLNSMVDFLFRMGREGASVDNLVRIEVTPSSWMMAFLDSEGDCFRFVKLIERVTIEYKPISAEEYARAKKEPPIIVDLQDKTYSETSRIANVVQCSPEEELAVLNILSEREKENRIQLWHVIKSELDTLERERMGR